MPSAFPQFNAGIGQHIRLKRDVGQMDFFLQAGGGFDLDQIPGIAGNGNQDVGPGVCNANWSADLDELPIKCCFELCYSLAVNLILATVE
jgi:hypothetical protein